MQSRARATHKSRRLRRARHDPPCRSAGGKPPQPRRTGRGCRVPRAVSFQGAPKPDPGRPVDLASREYRVIRTRQPPPRRVDSGGGGGGRGSHSSESLPDFEPRLRAPVLVPRSPRLDRSPERHGGRSAKSHHRRFGATGGCQERRTPAPGYLKPSAAGASWAAAKAVGFRFSARHAEYRSRNAARTTISAVRAHVARAACQSFMVRLMGSAQAP